MIQETYIKSLKTINSCNTEDQINTAGVYIRLAAKVLHRGTVSILMRNLNNRRTIIKGLYTQGTTIERI